MIILDTNVLSEPLKPQPDHTVLAWLKAQEPQTLYITSVNIAELTAGIAVMPAGKRREALQRALAQQVSAVFEGRVLPFDMKAGQVFGEVFANAQALGRPIRFAACAIAAIASIHDFAIATRNTGDFQGTGIRLLNPWTGLI